MQMFNVVEFSNNVAQMITISMKPAATQAQMGASIDWGLRRDLRRKYFWREHFVKGEFEEIEIYDSWHFFILISIQCPLQLEFVWSAWLFADSLAVSGSVTHGIRVLVSQGCRFVNHDLLVITVANVDVAVQLKSRDSTRGSREELEELQHGQCRLKSDRKRITVDLNASFRKADAWKTSGGKLAGINARNACL